MCFAVARLARLFQLPDFDDLWMTTEETFRSFFVKSQMSLTQLELDFGNAPSPSFGKTCPACSTQKTTPSAASWADLRARTLPCRPAQVDGRVQVMLPALRETSRGGCSTLNISECPNDVAESTLSQVLQRGGGIDPSKVLFEPQGVRRDSASCPNSEQSSAAFAESSFGAFRECGPAGTLKASGGVLGGAARL